MEAALGRATLDIHVSWNGDTETLTWRFYAQQTGGKSRLLGEVKREGFETHVTFNEESATKGSLITAQAIGGDGAVLRQSKPVLVYHVAAHPHRFDGSSLQWALNEEL
ncbi:hypothetical protein V2G26_010913 [Clonostachys chloroleuca]